MGLLCSWGHPEEETIPQDRFPTKDLHFVFPNAHLAFPISFCLLCVLFGPLANYDVSPDGRRFLMVKDAAPTQNITQINAVLNWFEELKRRVPTGQ